MKVYVLEYSCIYDEGSFIHGVFSTKDKAEKEAIRYSDGSMYYYHITEFDLDMVEE